MEAKGLGKPYCGLGTAGDATGRRFPIGPVHMFGGDGTAIFGAIPPGPAAKKGANGGGGGGMKF